MKIHYRVKKNTIEIIRCYGTDSRVVLPEEINGLPVVSAAPYAFSAHKDGEEDAETWESEDVISFGEERLLAGEEVQEIVFPDTLKEIGRYIFLFLFSSWCFHSTSIIKMINIILLLLYLRRFPDYYSLQYDN